MNSRFIGVSNNRNTNNKNSKKTMLFGITANFDKSRYEITSLTSKHSAVKYIENSITSKAIDRFNRSS